MSDLINQLTLITCGKGNFLELKMTLNSIREFKKGFPRQILVLSDYSEIEIAQIKKEFSVLNLEIFQTPANGVYEAMNIGLKKIDSGHVLFLNSGDTIFSETALNNLLKACQPNLWGYGKAMMVKISGETSTMYSFAPYIRNLHFLGLRFIPHPSTILPVGLTRQVGLFDLKYTVAADQKYLLQCSQISNPIVLDEPISKFNLGGLSTRSPKSIVQDFRKLSKELLPKSHFYNWPVFNPWPLVTLLRIFKAALLPKDSNSGL
jgi:hypothetical protein